MGTHIGFVLKKLGLLEFAHGVAQRDHSSQQASRIGLGPHMPVALWGCVLGKGRGGPQIQHQVKLVSIGGRFAREADGPSHLTLAQTGAVACARRHVNLVIQANGTFGAGGHAGIAPRAQVQIDGVGQFACQLERTQPTGQADHLATEHRVLAGLHARTAGRQQGHVQHVSHGGSNPFSLLQRSNDEQTTLAAVGHGGHRLRIGQLGQRQQSGHFGGAGCRLATPTTGFADVDEADGPHIG